MGIFRKIFGYSQREAWSMVANKIGAKFKQGSALEADELALDYLNHPIRVYVTSKGNSSAITRIETQLKTVEELELDEDYLSKFKKHSIELKLKESSPGRYVLYDFVSAENDINTNPDDLEEKINLFKEVILELHNKDFLAN